MSDTAETASQIIEIQYPCRDISITFEEPFLTGQFIADYNELAYGDPAVYQLEDFVHVEYGPHQAKFLEENGTCPSLRYTLGGDDPAPAYIENN